MKPLVLLARGGLRRRHFRRGDRHDGPVVLCWFTPKKAKASVSVRWRSATPYSKQIDHVRDEIRLLRDDWYRRNMMPYFHASHGGGAYASVGRFYLAGPQRRYRAITEREFATCIGELCRLLKRVFADDDSVLERMWNRS